MSRKKHRTSEQDAIDNSALRVVLTELCDCGHPPARATEESSGFFINLPDGQSVCRDCAASRSNAST